MATLNDKSGQDTAADELFEIEASAKSPTALDPEAGRSGAPTVGQGTAQEQWAANIQMDRGEVEPSSVDSPSGETQSVDPFGNLVEHTDVPAGGSQSSITEAKPLAAVASETDGCSQGLSRK